MAAIPSRHCDCTKQSTEKQVANIFERDDMSNYFGISHAKCTTNNWPARRRGGSFFSLDRKEAKDQVGKKASLPHKAFAMQIGQNHGLESFALLACASAKFPMPLPHVQGHHRSARFRPKLFCRQGGKEPSALGIEANTGPAAKACAV